MDTSKYVCTSKSHFISYGILKEGEVFFMCLCSQLNKLYPASGRYLGRPVQVANGNYSKKAPKMVIKYAKVK